MKQRLYHRIK